MPRILKFVALAAAFAAPSLFPSHSFAQSSSAFVVAPCVTASGPSSGSNGVPYCAPVTAGNPLPVSTTVTASVGGFQPTSQGTPISATTSGVAGALPAGISGVAQDVGSEPAYCQFGSSATGIVNGHYLSGAGAQWAYLVPSGATQLTCAGVGGTTQINLYGGSGLGVDTGAGGGSGGALTWPGTAGVAAGGVGTAGTMPYVNAYLPGTLPAFASTPTVNLGTLNGAATAANQEVTLAGTSASSAQGVQGVTGGVALPVSAASLPLPTGAATSALQTTGNSTLTTINTTLGSPFQAGASIGNTSFIATQSTAANLNMTCANCTGSGASGTDEGGFTAGTSVFAPSGGFFQTTATSNPLTNGQWGTLQLTANRAAFTNLRNASGTEIGTASNPVQVSVANTAANGTAMLVTGTGGTFPVSQATASSLNATVVGAGTAGTATGGVMTVQGVASMTPFLANPGTASLWGILAQGSTTSGELGQLSLGAVTTSAPSYTTAQSSPLSLDTSGNLRINCTTGCTGSGGTSSSFGSAFPATGTAIGLTNGTNMVAWSAASNYGTSPGAIAVPAVNASVTASALPSGAATAANQEVTLAGTSASSAQGVQGVTGGVAMPTNMTQIAGSTLAAPTAPGTPQNTGLIESVNVANTNPNGAAVPGSSSPVVSATMSHASTTALGTSLVAKASAGNLGAYNCTAITGGAAGYCIVYNGTTAPSTGALTGANVLDFCYFDTTPKGCSLTRLPNSIAFSTGIVVLVTSAASPYTYTTGTDTAAVEADYF